MGVGVGVGCFMIGTVELEDLGAANILLSGVS